MTRRLFSIAALLLPWMRPSNYSETPNSSPQEWTGGMSYRTGDGQWHFLETWTMQDGTKRIYEDGKLIWTLKKR